jgi:hypothetical protein
VGAATVKALVLAKLMLIGHALDLGKWYRTGASPLMWSSLHRGLVFLISSLDHDVFT